MKAIRRSTLRTALLGTLAAAVLGFHGAASAQVAGTIKIDAPLSLTGVAAFAGIAEKEGMDYAIEEINSSRFLGDAKLAANYVDVALATDQAVTAVRGFLRGDGGAIVHLAHFVHHTRIEQNSFGGGGFAGIDMGGNADISDAV